MKLINLLSKYIVLLFIALIITTSEVTAQSRDFEFIQQTKKKQSSTKKHNYKYKTLSKHITKKPLTYSKNAIIYQEDFEGDVSGWEMEEFSIQDRAYFHTDTYNSYGGSGKSWWCGASPLTQPDWAAAPGYGRFWTQYLTSPEFDLSNANAPSLSYYMRYDVEEDFDRINVDLSTDGKRWNTIATYTGTSNSYMLYEHSLQDYIGNSSIRVRFTVLSDESVDDEDGLGGFNSDGAVFLDSIVISDGSNILIFDDADSDSSTVFTPEFRPPFFWNLTEIMAESPTHSFWSGDSALLPNDTTMAPNVVTCLISPPIDLTNSNVKSAQLEFNIFSDLFPLNTGLLDDFWAILITKDGGDTLTNVTNSIYGGDTGGEFVSFTDNYDGNAILDDWLGETIQIYFCFSSNTDNVLGKGVFIDDIVIFTPEPDQNEPNDMLSNATEINIGEVVDGLTIAPEGDIDYFKYNSPGNEKIQIDLLIEGISNLDGIIALFDENGDSLARKDSHLEGIDESLSYSIENSGTYYIGIAHFTTLSKMSSPIGAYNIRLTRTLGGIELFSEGFESTQVGSIPTGWTLIDVDGGPGGPGSSGIKTWIVITPDLWRDNSNYAFKGTGFAGVFYNDDQSQNDDWLITPSIDIDVSSDQTLLSFWASSQDSAFRDAFEVRVSTTGTDISDFGNPIVKDESVEAEWAEYKVSLESFEGNKIFVAFRYNAIDKFLLKIDDVRIINTKPTSIENTETKVLTEYSLYPNYPNPFNPSTIIKYQLKENTHVRLIVYDMLGREVRTLVDHVQNANNYSVQWDGKDNNGSNVASGIYLYQIKADRFVKTQRMVLLK